MAEDCPECEYCCAIGLCCPPAAQLAKLSAMFVRETGCSLEEAHQYASVIVKARKAAQTHESA
jgi:hypothetical protein